VRYVATDMKDQGADGDQGIWSVALEIRKTTRRPRDIPVVIGVGWQDTSNGSVGNFRVPSPGAKLDQKKHGGKEGQEGMERYLTRAPLSEGDSVYLRGIKEGQGTSRSNSNSPYSVVRHARDSDMLR